MRITIPESRFFIESVLALVMVGLAVSSVPRTHQSHDALAQLRPRLNHTPHLILYSPSDFDLTIHPLPRP